MTAKRICALLALFTLSNMPSYGHAAPAMPSVPGGTAVERVQDRLEMRSFQPYAGLQDENVPVDAPIQRGVRKTRPEIVRPTAVNPVIETGVPRAFTAQWYKYCAQRYRSFEPGTGLYTSFSGQRRQCR